MEQKHGKQKKGARHNKKLIVKRIMIRISVEKLLPFVILALDYAQDGQINGFGLLPVMFS